MTPTPSLSERLHDDARWLRENLPVRFPQIDLSEIAARVKEAAAEIASLQGEVVGLRAAIKAIKKATIDGRVCDDVAWFDQITTLHDFCDQALEASLPAPATAEGEVADRETVQILLDLLNPLHGNLDRQTYDQKVDERFDAPPDAEREVTITAQQERDLSQAVCILESRLRSSPATGEG